MNQELLESLEKEKNEKLFFNFKHDGNINFEYKLLSGKILSNRKYDINKLKEEKEKIVKSIQDQVNESKNLECLRTKNRKEAIKSILNSLFPAFIIFILYLYNFITEDNPAKSDYYLLFSIVAALIALALFKIYNFKKKVNKLIETDINGGRLLEKRLTLINQEWDF